LHVVADTKADPAQPQQQPLRTLSYFIKYNDLIYLLLGLSTQSDFPAYASYFQHSSEGFGTLTDPARLNKKPERVRIKTVNANITLEQALKGYSVASARMDEHAVLNGMKLSDKISPGTMIKVIAN
jgi:predicted Zn-dependent protease